MFDDLRDSVRDFSERTRKAIAEKEITEDLLEDVLWELEQEMLKNNVAYDVVEEIRDELGQDLVGKNVSRRKADKYIRDALKNSLLEVLEQDDVSIKKIIAEETPALVLFMGFNGSGKTTTLAKIAHMLKEDHGVILAAGDTFRSASIEQLEEHGERLGLEVVKHDYGADSAAVIYDAVEHAEKEGVDAVLADTAGRSHRDRNLMDELEKVCEVNDPDLKILVVDALAGNDVVEQAGEYERIGFDAVILTKADVDKKGGAALSLGYVTGKPILYLGTGQGYEDLERFDPDSLVEGLLGM